LEDIPCPLSAQRFRKAEEKEGGARRTQFAAVILTSSRVTGVFIPRTIFYPKRYGSSVDPWRGTAAVVGAEFAPTQAENRLP